jgi:adenylate cyclase
MRKIPDLRSWIMLAALAGACAWSSWLGVLHLSGRAALVDQIEAPLVDMRFALSGPRPAPAVTIVALDDETARVEGRFPPSRRRLADLVRLLAAARPRALALDILFLDPGEPEETRRLSEALATVPSVLAAAGTFDHASRAAIRSSGPLAPGQIADLPVARQFLLPLAEFRKVAAVGLVNVTTDAGGTPRHVPLLMQAGDGLLASFPLRAAAVSANAEPEIGSDHVWVGPVRSATEPGLSLPLRFYGPRGTIPTISAARVLAGEADAALFRDRVVVVGATALGSGDTFPTPFDPVTPGVEIMATALGHLITGDGLVRTTGTRRADAMAAVILTMAALAGMALNPVGLGFLFAAAIIAGWVGIAVLAFGQNVWLTIALPLVAMLPPLAVQIGARLWLDGRSERRLTEQREAFQRFHPPLIADRLARSSDFLSAPVSRDAAILFCDLSGFTGLAERIGPEATREVLAAFHRIVETAVEHAGGMVLSFMGDGALAVFGLAETDPQDAERALRAGQSLARDVLAWLDEQRAMMPGIGVKIGAHFGPVVVSRLGSDLHQHITVTGDSVNVASRLQEVAAAHGAVLAVSTDLADAAGAGAEELGPAVEVSLRGRTRPVRVRLWGACLERPARTAP